MKRGILPLLFILLVVFAQAQNIELLPDQNPNYLVSRQKYMNQKDSLLSWSNTTIQNTYKAYDWREAREERRAERRSYRRQTAQFAPSLNYGYPFGWNSYGYGAYNSYNWNRWGISRPFIGFRSGNWWFGF